MLTWPTHSAQVPTFGQVSGSSSAKGSRLLNGSETARVSSSKDVCLRFRPVSWFCVGKRPFSDCDRGCKEHVLRSKLGKGGLAPRAAKTMGLEVSAHQNGNDLGPNGARKARVVWEVSRLHAHPNHYFRRTPLLGLLVVPLYPFLGDGSPTKIDCRKKGTLILSSLLEDLGYIPSTQSALTATCLDVKQFQADTKKVR